MKYEIGKDGNAVEARGVGALNPIAWTEVDMQYVLGLNPQLLGASDALAVGRDGGSNEHMSDMLYVDEIGRATIVELKRKSASLEDLAQLLGYAEHERHLPHGEIERRHLCAEHGWNSNWRSRAIDRVRELARTGESPGGEKGTVIPLHEPNRETFEQKARKKWGDRAFSLRGSPPRSILISTDGSKCDDFTRKLQKRYVNVRLIDAGLFRSADGRLVLEWKPRELSENPSEDFLSRIDLMWDATRYLWHDDFIRDNFEPNGWAEHCSSEYVSFSARESGRVRFYLSRDDENRVNVETEIPHKWCSPAERRTLRLEHEARLAKVPAQREFLLAEEHGKFVETTSALARELLAVLTS